MDPKYDLKFKEMKKYIPFLESMINRLKDTGPESANPRQAQLDKIRSLRDLLLNKKKRMKMENLLKCEQVLINLYAKVEQRDTVVEKEPDPGFSIDPPTPQEKSDLEAVRSKLKTVTKRQEDIQETLPEILRVDEVEEMHTAGSKEPALFQRRPNKSSMSPTHRSPIKMKEEKLPSPSSASKRNYTRVLVSPDSSARCWSTADSAEEKPLFSRRSPRRSPRRYSPSYHKKERKKSLKESTARKSKDLNITLNVPEDSLSTLNTKDIFTRIINCKDGDVDIDTLRGLRKQILTELKKTGARDDISDLILKSYSKKKGRSSKKKEVEEGELSDSESEIIENVYGSLSGNLILQDQGDAQTSTDTDKARKIQICLVINSDKNKPDPNTNSNLDVLELEMYDNESKEVDKTGSNNEKNKQDIVKIDDVSKPIPDMQKNDKEDDSTDKATSKNNSTDIKLQIASKEKSEANTPIEPVKNTANFYKPMNDSSKPVEANQIEGGKDVKLAQVENKRETDIKTDSRTETSVSEVHKTNKDVCLIETELEKMEKPVEIPLLNEPVPKTPTNSTLSEIDILQALKKEILSESITIPGSEASTPLLHQPKINKVASAKEIMPKKRISIENYKQKADRDKVMMDIKIVTSTRRYYRENNDSIDDLVKKPSLKLTEKECERFNIQKKISFDDDSSDVDDGSEIQASDLYSDLAPISPDRDESSNMESTPPVIIPGDPVKAVTVNRNADVDMRTLPILSPNQNKAPTSFSNISGLLTNDTKSATKIDTKMDKIKSQNKPVLLDPRVRRDVNLSQSPSPHTANPDRTPRSTFSNIILSPASNASMTPNVRSYEVTPNHQSFEVDQSNKKHVYVPSFTMIDSREGENSVARDLKVVPSAERERKSRFEDIGDTSSWSSSDVSINTRYTDSFTVDKYSQGQRTERYNSLENRDGVSFKRSECPRTPLPSFGRSDVPVTTTQTFSRLDNPMTPLLSYVRAECPSTPIHQFGRSECPPTPSHPFGRLDCPPTPSHPFGRSDGPATPIHPFGSLSFNINELPLTPIHQFGATECPAPYYGRIECPTTPNHGFGRSDCPSTPNHPFGRSDFNAQKYTKDPRLNRKPEYESNSQLNERDRGYYKDSGYFRGSSYQTQKSFSGSDKYTSQDREQARNSKYRYYAPELSGRKLKKDPPRHELTVSSMPKEFENDRVFSRDRGQYNSEYEDAAFRRGNQRERNIGHSVHPEDNRERRRHVHAEDTFTRSSSRVASISNSPIEPKNKSLTVKSDTGRSFKIDTSVNETFQNFLDSGKGIQVSECNFDTRRQRAASVGRSLVQESRCEPVSDSAKRNTECYTHNKKEVFRRASSMGRDSADYAADKRSFQEIKTDFKAYKHPGKETTQFDTGKIRNIDTKSKTNTESIARSKREKEYYAKHKEDKRIQSSSKLTYSPKKIYRDPKMRKENNTKSKYDDPRARKSGIVYSNDNIVKGAILASGYGVKNYKIPKIKRVVEEKQVEAPIKEKPVNKKDEKEKDKRKNVDKRKYDEITIKEKANDNSKDKNKVTPKQKNKEAPNERFNESSKNKEIKKESDTISDYETEKLQKQIDDSSESDEPIGRRSTRSSRKLAVKNTVKDTTTKTKKPMKSIMSDSDSEMENTASEILPRVADTDLRNTTPTEPPQVTSPVKEIKIPKQPNAIDMHTNFGLELEMFTDNVVSDPVLDNINELIADLDNDLDATKSETSSNFTNEITLENMMQNITSLSSSSQDNLSGSRDEFSQVLKAVDELSKTNLNETNSVVLQELKNTEDSKSNKSKAAQSFDNLLASVKSSQSASVQSDAVEMKKDGDLNSNNHPLSQPTNEDIVSTTEIEEDTLSGEGKLKIDEQGIDGSSTPDSTINIDFLDKNKNDDCVADSTNEEAHNETNVTSTDSVEPKPSLTSTETDSDLALGNLLTMLQDKSKIKKLLSMLGDQSGDNDKIKKKLEKLSEIVSDDEIEEKTEQPELKTETELSVLTDDKEPDTNQTIDEVATKETESQLHDSAKTNLNKGDGEKKRNENDEKTQFDENNEKTQFDENNEKTQFDENNEKTQFDENNEKKQFDENNEKTQFDENNEKTQFNENDEKKQLNEGHENYEKKQLNEDHEIDAYQDEDESFEDLIGEDANKAEGTDLQVTKPKNKKKMTGKKSKFSRKGKGRWPKKVTSIAEKRVTRATAANETITKPKKPTRELQKLHDDIKEMFIRDDILSATGIRMCRLAKMVDEKPVPKEEAVLPESEPVVVLEKFKNSADKSRDNSIPEKVRKKPGPKPRPKISTVSLPEIQKPKYKPGPKSKTKYQKELDPYAFEPESVADTTIENASEVDSDNSSDSEVGSLVSSKSFGSTEVLAEIKKKNKRKRGRGWQDGVIKPKNKKKRLETKLETNVETFSNMYCYTDKEYCFRKNELIYSCRLCGFEGTNIVHHYISEHPHDEIPLSRMDPNQADEAIAQSKEINIPAIRKMPSEKYVCIFCFKEFAYNSSVLETFFWHIVSMHTGEYKHKCCECPLEKTCPPSLDIPSPPKQTKGQLIGYICTRCNYTQLSLENLKNHVIKRHDDEQTPVYTINLSAMSKKTLKNFLRDKKILEPPVDDSSLRDVTAKLTEKPSDIAEGAESESPLCKPAKKILLASIKSKITFEADDNASELSDFINEEPIEAKVIKIERVESENTDEILKDEPQSVHTAEINHFAEVDHQPIQLTHQDDQQSSLGSRLEDLANQPSNDIVDYPHFKIHITESGAKEYICCINGKDNHFKTTLLISMKKHVQLKHSEIWDGYCFICKVIVTPQGAHTFKDCFQHYLDKHMDNFPIYQKEIVRESTTEEIPDKQVRQTDSPASSNPFINVRPICDLISTSADDTPNETSSFPIIQSVVSLGAESPRINPTYPSVRQEKQPTEPTFKYEEAQAKVMLNKHRVVLETMMALDKLVQVYKCAGRFCSFTSDSAEDALLHASTHQRIGGVDALNCSYCDFDALGNAIDLVMHVFRVHGHCQYSCGQCFYRAAASQSVGAHASRVHGVALSAATSLRTTVAATAGDGGGMLTREQAVPYYRCCHAKGKCKYQTFTPNEFKEHLQQHVGATSHRCYICKEEAPSPIELLAHMTSHGLNLFQCTWCVLGADSEAELLAHTSAVHPTKQPQAYLRTITDKQRVLPLTYLNIIEVPSEDVAPSAVKENPVREAERSISLEKLIGVNLMMEIQQEFSAPTAVHAEPAPVHTEPALVHTQPPKDIILASVKQPVAPIALVAPTVSVVELQALVPTVVASITAPVKTDVTSPPSEHTQGAAVKSEPSLTITKVPIKAELETPKELPSEVVVLDSDDDEPSLPVIDLSDDDATTSASDKHTVLVQTTSQKVPMDILSTCPKCQQICKSINGLKKHFFYCYPNKNEGCKCAHCPYMASSRDQIMDHYMFDHCDKITYQCGVCRTNQVSLPMAKRHLKDVHKEKDHFVASVIEKGMPCYVVNPKKKDKKELPKRKHSANNPDTLSKRRFWPGEINQLPINPILEHLVYCEICEFSTKVRLNMVRHLQLHAEQQPAPNTAPVNPVPHLETNEMHFDRMVNLASSSLAPHRAERPAPERLAPERSARTLPAPPERLARYPRFIPARQRNTCGGVGCSYTAVDEPTLRRHWEALHAGPGSNAFRCVHCPDSQTTDTSKPITAARVVQHLKMHDDTLYACPQCDIYYYKRDYLEKHMMELHQNAPYYIVRESASAAAAAATAAAVTAAAPSPSAAPTMDLKPWQCGFCEFKSMLRPEVAEHCFKLHQSKMQFRCGYCPYRASALENVNNHLAHSHPKEPEDVIYYYYREGSLPDEVDGTARWMKQRQKVGPNMPQVKTEEQETPDEAPVASLPPVNIDLKLVKKEVDESVLESVESMEELCKRFGQFCEPNGIQFKCPLCNVISEDTREAMQSHLYEELQYRKWGCGLCNYKAFHKLGLTEHMATEHFRQYDHIELPKDVNKEKWVAGQLDHQAAIIDKHKANLANQKIVVERSNKPAPIAALPTDDVVETFSVKQLEEAFGEFGAPSNMMFCCPKCGTLLKDEAAMRDHLEMELNMIRWGCTNCSVKYQTYHEAQFHCKGHDGPSRPKEAVRDPSMRAAWLTYTIQAQKKTLQTVSATPTTSEPSTPDKSFTEIDNSLLVVRYEERVPTPDLVPVSRKRPAPESDDERLIIDEAAGHKKTTVRQCPACPFKHKYYNAWKEHVLTHYNLKPYSCYYCDYSCSYKASMVVHFNKFHPDVHQQTIMNAIPPAKPHVVELKKRSSAGQETMALPARKSKEGNSICLFCENSIPETDVDTHLHENIRPDFARKGDVVYKCCICLVLRLDVKSLHEHHNLAHPHVPVNYALFKLHHDTRETHYCGHCDHTGFKFLRDLKSHHNAVHPTLLFKYTTVPYVYSDSKKDRKKEEAPLQKRCARKSTTKLPGNTVAKKSTTRLPYSVPGILKEGYSFYRTKPEPLEKYANVTTLMSFCNRMVPFTLKKLSEIINIEPKVIVKDIRAGTSKSDK